MYDVPMWDVFYHSYNPNDVYAEAFESEQDARTFAALIQGHGFHVMRIVQW